MTEIQVPFLKIVEISYRWQQNILERRSRYIFTLFSLSGFPQRTDEKPHKRHTFTRNSCGPQNCSGVVRVLYCCVKLHLPKSPSEILLNLSR